MEQIRTPIARAIPRLNDTNIPSLRKRQVSPGAGFIKSALRFIAFQLAGRVWPQQVCQLLVGRKVATETCQIAILVQAYSFTSVPILAALKIAHARGVDVEVIVDKSSAQQSKSGSRYSAAIYLANAWPICLGRLGDCAPATRCTDQSMI